jgi:hypothetical protein
MTFMSVKTSAFVVAALILAMSAIPSLAAYGVQAKTSQCVGNQALPDSDCTPGAVLTTNAATVCAVGYTKTVRNVPLSESKQVFAEYGIAYKLHANYEVDHLISLELGGSNAIANLWPESSLIQNGSLTKDKFENYLHAQVCSGKMSLSDAQAEISSNWLQYYSTMTTANTKVVSKSKTTIVPSIPTNASGPAGATALCRDGSYSYSKTHTGACSHHGGVAKWY